MPEFREDAKEQEKLNSEWRMNIIREAADQRRDQQRPIGSEAVLNGKPVLWAGPDLAWQSPETFEKLQTEGYDGDQDYMLSGGWQSRRANLGITEALKIAAPVVEPIVTAAGDQYEQFKRGNPLGAWYLESVGQGVGWGLNKLEQGTTALSRATGVHPFWGNTTIEGIAELATPYIPLAGIVGALKHGDNLGDVAGTLRTLNKLEQASNINTVLKDRTLSRLLREQTAGWKPRSGEKIYTGNNFLGDARRLRQKGLTPEQVSAELGVKVREVNGIPDVQRLRGSTSSKDKLGMKSQSSYEANNTAINRRLNELQKTPGKITFNQQAKEAKEATQRYATRINKHHGVGLDATDFLYEGISIEDAQELTRYIFEDLMEPTGSILENRNIIPDSEVHRLHHTHLREDVIGLEKTKDKSNIMPSLTRYFKIDDATIIPLQARKEAAQIWFENIAPHLKEDLFKRQMDFMTKGEWSKLSEIGDKLSKDLPK